MSRAASVLIVLLFLAALAAVQHVASFDARGRSLPTLASSILPIYSNRVGSRSESGYQSYSTGQVVNRQAPISPNILVAQTLFLSPAVGAHTRPSKALPLLGMVGLGSLVAGFIMPR